MNEVQKSLTANILLIWILRRQGNIIFLSIWPRSSVDVFRSILSLCSALNCGAFVLSAKHLELVCPFFWQPPKNFISTGEKRKGKETRDEVSSSEYRGVAMGPLSLSNSQTAQSHLFVLGPSSVGHVNCLRLCGRGGGQCVAWSSNPCYGS